MKEHKAKLKVPLGMGLSFSIGGKVYEADPKTRAVEVDAEHVAQAVEAGLVSADAKEDEK